MSRDSYIYICIHMCIHYPHTHIVDDRIPLEVTANYFLSRRQREKLRKVDD